MRGCAGAFDARRNVRVRECACSYGVTLRLCGRVIAVIYARVLLCLCVCVCVCMVIGVTWSVSTL